MKPACITIEPGSVITVKGIEEQSGFVDVFYRGRMVKVVTTAGANNATVRSESFGGLEGKQRVADFGLAGGGRKLCL
jgi:hypothetical protein